MFSIYQFWPWHLLITYLVFYSYLIVFPCRYQDLFCIFQFIGRGTLKISWRWWDLAQFQFDHWSKFEDLRFSWSNKKLFWRVYCTFVGDLLFFLYKIVLSYASILQGSEYFTIIRMGIHQLQSFYLHCNRWFSWTRRHHDDLKVLLFSLCS